ncbi:MAG: hypothetical protein LV481_11230 [Methylacidiphilales bacterium]|nr:hypothetical protein [Candidatus Methylacidiphilales bacterium]
MTTQPKSQPNKKLIVFPQDKGGIGKSFVATLLYDYLTEKAVKLKTFDLDHANSTFQRFVPEAEFIDTDVDANKLAVLDIMVNSLETADVALVDNRASGGTKVLRYIEDSRLTELQKQLNFELVFVVIALQDKDAISQIADLLDEYHDRVLWLVVRNYRDTATITMYDGSKTRERLQAKGTLEIEVPCLTEVTRNKLQMSNLTVSKGRTSPQVHLLDRSRCQTFHEAMMAQFDKAKGVILP